MRIMAKRLQVLEGRFREISTERVAPRLARELVRLLPQVGRRVDGALEINLSREELAQMTATTLFTVSRLALELGKARHLESSTRSCSGKKSSRPVGISELK